MKILDKYLLKTFLITFTTVFVILFFIFILQTIWLFIAELAGKDLDTAMILKFLLFSMPRIVPLVLPLSILLASIMTFGNLAENYEFAAMKSAGISLQRALRGLTIFIFILSIVAFYFANNVIPFAEYKFINFRKNIAQVKPALAITEGQFSNVGIYNIKVNKKSGENGNVLTGITIHKKSSMGDGSKIVIKAKDGELISSEQSSILKLVLNNGNYYEDIIPKKYGDREKLPFAKSSFKKYTINIDLSQLNKVDVNEQNVSNTNTMLTVSELNYTLDSLQKNMKMEVISFSENISLQTGITNLINNKNNNIIIPPKDSLVKLKEMPKDILSLFSNQEKLNIFNSFNSNLVNIGYNIDSSKTNLENKQKTINNKNSTIIIPPKDSLVKLKDMPKNLLSLYSNQEKLDILNSVTSNLSNIGYNINASKTNLENKQKTINNHQLALYDKFVIAFACFLMFFIGAPLGAIIRKGGLGLPIVFAVLIFITFHFINTFGKRISQEDGLSPFLGAWMSSFILTPLAIVLTYRATNDIGLINIDLILSPFQKFIKKIFQNKNNSNHDFK